MTWNVVYWNGKSDHGLCHRCVRPFAPFVIGETIKYSRGHGVSSASDARVIGIDKGHYDIEVAGTEILRKVPINRLHRSVTDKYIYKKGRHALVKIGPDPEDVLTVIVLRVNGNGTFTVGTPDGLTGNVNASQLQPHLTWYEEYISY